MEGEQKYTLSYVQADGSLLDSQDDRTVRDLLKLFAEEIPDKEAVVFAHIDGTREAVTYTELYEKSSHVAKSYLTLGVKPSEIVAISMRSCPQWLYAVFGAMIAGVRPIGLSFTYTDGSDVIALMKQLQTCSVFVLDPGEEDENWKVFLKLVNSFDGKGNVQSDKMPYLRNLIYHDCKKRQTPNVLTMEQIMKWNDPDRSITLPCLKPDDIAMMFQTSGSTGVPKVVAHSHRTLVNVVGGLPDDFKEYLDTKGSLFNDRSFTWAGGFPFNIMCGTTRVTRAGFGEPPEDLTGFLIDVIKQEKCTDLLVLQGLLNMFLERQEDIGDDWPIETVVTGGQPLTKQFTNCIGKLCKQCIVSYGGTETMAISSLIINHPDEFEDFCCGKITAGVSMKIVDDAGEIVPVNTSGEILIKSKNLFKEYCNDSEKTKAVYTSDGWFKTDDIGFMKENGMLFCVGKKTDMIISGGMNVAPVILEAIIEKYPGVARAICVPIPHSILHQVVCACVKLEEGSDVTEEQLRLYCEEIHNDKSRVFTVLPKYYMFKKEFPETYTGKIARRLLTTEATQLFCKY